MRGAWRQHLPPVLMVGWILALHWTYSQRWPRPFDDWKEGLFYVGAGLLVCGWLWRHRHEGIRIPVGLAVAYGLYAGTVLLSAFSTPAANYETLLAVCRLLLWGGFAWAASLLSPSILAILLRWSMISAALIVASNLIDIKWYDFWPNLGGGPFFLPPIGHLSYYGDAMALHLPFAVGFMATATSRRMKGLWGSCCVFLFMGVWLSGARASLLGLCVAALAIVGYAWRRRWLRRRPVAAAGLALVGTLALFSVIGPTYRSESMPQRLGRIFHLGSARQIDEFLQGRDLVYRLTTNVIRARPLTGWGPGSFRFVYPEFAEGRSSAHAWLMHPHNEFLHQAAEVGLFGLLGFFCVFVAWGDGARRLLRHAPASPERVEILMALGGLLTAFVSWQFNTTFTHPLVRLLTGCCAAVLWRSSRSHSRSLSLAPGLRARALVCGGLVAAAIATLVLAAYFGSLFATHRAGQRERSADRFRWARVAYSLAPGAFDPSFNYAMLQLYEDERNARDLSALNTLYARFPFVPVVLYHAAVAQRRADRPEEARSLLLHALRNAQTFQDAETFLQQIADGQKNPP